MTHYFILNPAAGKGDETATMRSLIMDFFTQRNEPYEIAVTEYPGHGTQLAREFCLREIPGRVYACGGDGTLNEVVAGCVGHPHVAVTNFAFGTGNDFIKVFGDTAGFHSLEALVDGPQKDIDVVDCGHNRYAINTCSAGLDARIGAGVVRFKRLPLVSGFGAYILSTIYHVIRGIHSNYTIQVDGETIRGHQTMVCIANGSWYGGGFHPVPEARPDDGYLDVLLVKPVSRLTVAKVIGKYKEGKFRELPDYIRYIRTKSITITCEPGDVLGIDGEVLDANTATFSVGTLKVPFFYPAVLASPRGEVPAEAGGEGTAARESVCTSCRACTD